EHFANLLTRLLVVRTEHRAARASRRRGHLWIARDSERLRDHDADAARLPSLPDVHPAQLRVVANRIWRIAVRHLEFQCARVQVDRWADAVGRFHNRQTIEALRQATASAPTPWRRGCRTRLRGRAASTARSAATCRHLNPGAARLVCAVPAVFR